ncbi:aspartic proteinase cdr1-like protein, partial [Trifolium pratense]
METLTLESTTGVPISFPKTVIGCATNNTMSFQGASSGIVGLGGGPDSQDLIAQLGSLIDGKFSYCLLPLFLESNTTSKLNFGDVAVVSGDGVVSTPIAKNYPPVFYILTLEAFSLGNKRVEFGGSLRGEDEGNIFIDSGTTYTILPSDVYANLESAMLELVKLERVDDPNHTLNLCYSITSDGYDFPLITAHFKDADVKLHSISTFVPIAEDIVCFA